MPGCTGVPVVSADFLIRPAQPDHGSGTRSGQGNCQGPPSDADRITARKRRLRNPQRPVAGGPPGGQGTAEILQLRPVVTALAQEATNLNTLTSSEGRRNPDLRRLQPDLLKFQTMATALKQRTDIERRDHRVLADPCRQLSQDWKKHLFSSAVNQRGLSPQSRQSIERVSQLESRSASLFGIQDTFDGRELVRTADCWWQTCESLLTKFLFEWAEPLSRTRLPISLRRHQERASQFANLAASGTPLRSLLTDYQNLFRDWQAIRPELTAFQPHHFRTLARIQETHRSLHRVQTQLWTRPGDRAATGRTTPERPHRSQQDVIWNRS